MNKRLIQLVVGLAISSGLLALLVTKLDTTAVTTAVAGADVRFIPPAVGIYLVAMYVRSLVWQRLLSVRVPTVTLLRATIVGFAVSYVMPLRVGEIGRAYLLRRWRGIDYGTTLASLVGERVLDGLAVGAIIMVALLFVPAPRYVLGLGIAVGVVFIALTVGLIVVSSRTDGVAWVVSWVAGRLPRRSRPFCERLGAGFVRGLVPLQNRRALPGLAALAVLGWLCQFTVFYLLMLAFPMPASFPAALLVGGVANFATLLPSAPGYVGTFDAALVKLLIDLQGVGLEQAAAYAVVVHTVLVVPIVILGALVLWKADLSFGHVLGRSMGSKRPAVSAAAPAAIGSVVP